MYALSQQKSPACDVLFHHFKQSNVPFIPREVSKNDKLQVLGLKVQLWRFSCDIPVMCLLKMNWVRATNKVLFHLISYILSQSVTHLEEQGQLIFNYHVTNSDQPITYEAL